MHVFFYLIQRSMMLKHRKGHCEKTKPYFETKTLFVVIANPGKTFVGIWNLLVIKPHDSSPSLYKVADLKT